MQVFRSKGVLGKAKRRGFTLLEVILAITIAAGLLVAMLEFYNQVANIRTQLLQEAERLTTIRLLLDRLTTDLRSARSDAATAQGLTGGENSLQLVRVDLPPASAWAKTEPGRATGPQTDLKVVSYGITTKMEGTNPVVSGLLRTERPLVQLKVIESHSPAPLSTEPEPEAKRTPEPLTDAVGFLYFRYWDGTAWLPAWKDAELPQGVEVTLGAEPASPGTTPEDYPFEMFRRVVYLPGHGTSEGFVERTVIEESNLSPEATP